MNSDAIFEGLQREKAIDGVNTGFKRFDKYTQGLRSGCSYLFSGLEKSGKTTFLINIISNMINNGDKVGIVSTELSLKQLSRKFGKINNIDPDSPEEMLKYQKKLMKYFSYVGNENGDLSKMGMIDVEKMLVKIKELSDDGCRTIFVDNLTVIQNQGTWQAMSSAGQKIVTLTKQLKSAVVVVAHTKPYNITFKLTPEGIKTLVSDNRSEEIFDEQAIVITRPTVSDIYGGGGYSSQFDGVILFWRPFQKFNDSHLKGQTAIIIDSLREQAEAEGDNLVKLTFNIMKEEYKELQLTPHEQTKAIFQS